MTHLAARLAFCAFALSWCSLSAQTSPTDNAADPTLDAASVTSVYGDTYTSIATNFDPFWGQSGHTLVNPAFDPGTGNTVLAYPNMNYQGTDLAAQNLSSMTHLHLDVWVSADNSGRMLKVSPINNGTGSGEYLVEVPTTPGSWNSVDLPKSAFDGMVWDNVFQMKFDGQFNADGSANGAGWDVYLDNIYFYNDGSGTETEVTYVDVTFSVNTDNITVGPNGMYVGGGFLGGSDAYALTDNGDNNWSTTISIAEGTSGHW
ncbi:MAG: hypothetical protein ACPGGB_10530, partial [Flavobacteriales bacterium]